MNKTKNRVGEKFITNEGCKVEIIEYFSSKNCTIQFEDGKKYLNKEYSKIVRGQVKNPYHNSILNIGYIGEGTFKVKCNKKITKEYSLWRSILQRGYNLQYKEKYPTYKDVTVCEEWHNFQNFAEWVSGSYVKDFEIDKDILVKGNKIYSPKTCCFVPKEINYILTKNNSKRGNLPIGVKKVSNSNKFQSSISKIVSESYLGSFNTPEEAFQAYKQAKEAYIKEVAEKWKDKIDQKVYQALQEYQVEITD